MKFFPGGLWHSSLTLMWRVSLLISKNQNPMHIQVKTPRNVKKKITAVKQNIYQFIYVKKIRLWPRKGLNMIINPLSMPSFSRYGYIFLARDKKSFFLKLSDGVTTVMPAPLSDSSSIIVQIKLSGSMPNSGRTMSLP